jgi:hypothetical protein
MCLCGCAEVLRWLKGALLELEACRVRGHLDEKRPSLASLLGLGQAHAHADDASTRGKGKGVRRDHMTASQFAQSILQVRETFLGPRFVLFFR